MPIAEAVEQLAYDYLRDTHAGWEDNEGAYGEFVFDVAAGTVTFDYDERYVDTTNTSHQF